MGHDLGASRTAATIAPPVMEARRWLEAAPEDRALALINVSQAAPVDPPPAALRAEIARIALEEDDAHLYGSVLGFEPLRAALAEVSAGIYGGAISAGQVAITSGCNQAFAGAISALTREDDEVILPVPWYFNHKMWLDMVGVRSVPLATGPDLLPDPERAAALITPRTRAIALVSPNNPGGVEYPAALVRAFFELCRARGIALILDETYRDFDSRSGAPHDLFRDPDWDRTLIHLYSFSKAYRLTGHRVGAMITGLSRLAEVEKFFDTVAICPNQIGQRAALWAMQNLKDWLAGERREVLARRAAIARGFDPLAARGWRLDGLGAYFAYLRHPFDLSAEVLAPRLVAQAGILLLPGTMFAPPGDAVAAASVRIAFANLDQGGIARLLDRLAGLRI